jgi:hypothetical protein
MNGFGAHKNDFTLKMVQFASSLIFQSSLEEWKD